MCASDHLAVFQATVEEQWKWNRHVDEHMSAFQAGADSERATLLKSLDHRLKAESEEVAHRTHMEKLQLARHAAQARVEFSLHLDRAHQQQCRALDEQTSAQMQWLQDEALHQKSTLEAQATALKMEFEQRRVQEDEMMRRYQLQRQHFENQQSIQERLQQCASEGIPGVPQEAGSASMMPHLLKAQADALRRHREVQMKHCSVHNNLQAQMQRLAPRQASRTQLPLGIECLLRQQEHIASRQRTLQVQYDTTQLKLQEALLQQLAGKIALTPPSSLPHSALSTPQAQCRELPTGFVPVSPQSQFRERPPQSTVASPGTQSRTATPQARFRDLPVQPLAASLQMQTVDMPGMAAPAIHFHESPMASSTVGFRDIPTDAISLTTPTMQFRALPHY